MSNTIVKDIFFASFKQIFTHYLVWISIVFGIIYLLTGFYKIDRNEVGVVLQFGKVIHQRVLPGLHYTLPFNTLHKVSVKEIQTETIDRFAISFSENSPAAQFKNKTGINPYIITGDNNIVTIKLLIKYKITTPYNYLFTVKDANRFLSPLAASSLIQVFTSQTIDSVLTYGKRDIEQQTKRALQKELSSIETGLSISFIEIQEIAPPERVSSAFNDVINARMDYKKKVNESRSYKNEVVPQARTTANRALSSAEADATSMVLKSQGESEAFVAKLQEYRKDKISTRERYYLDFIKDISTNVKELRIIKGQ